MSFDAARDLLISDLRAGYDYALHLGQAGATPHLRLEAVGSNIAEDLDDVSGPTRPLLKDGPDVLESELPIERWRLLLDRHRVPAVVSHDAGTYVCNALLYWSLYYVRELDIPTQSVLIHVPLTPRQARDGNGSGGLGLDPAHCARGVGLILDDLVALGAGSNTAQRKRVIDRSDE